MHQSWTMKKDDRMLILKSSGFFCGWNLFDFTNIVFKLIASGYRVGNGFISEDIGQRLFSNKVPARSSRCQAHAARQVVFLSEESTCSMFWWYCSHSHTCLLRIRCHIYAYKHTLSCYNMHSTQNIAKSEYNSTWLPKHGIMGNPMDSLQFCTGPILVTSCLLGSFNLWVSTQLLSLKYRERFFEHPFKL